MDPVGIFLGKYFMIPDSVKLSRYYVLKFSLNFMSDVEVKELSYG